MAILEDGVSRAQKSPIAIGQLAMGWKRGYGVHGASTKCLIRTAKVGYHHMLERMILKALPI